MEHTSKEVLEMTQAGQFARVVLNVAIVPIALTVCLYADAVKV